LDWIGIIVLLSIIEVEQLFKVARYVC